MNRAARERVKARRGAWLRLANWMLARMSRQEIPGAPSAKRWLALVAIVATAPGGCGFDAERTGSPEGREAVQPPNILWVCTEHQRFDTIHALGNPFIRAPNLERLVSEGVDVTHAFARTRSVRRADDDFYHMWFTQLDDVGAMVIGLATSEYGIEWEKADAPFLVPNPESDWDSIYCSNTSIVIEPDGRYKLYYASRIDMQHKYFAIGLAVREGEEGQ